MSDVDTGETMSPPEIEIKAWNIMAMKISDKTFRFEGVNHIECTTSYWNRTCFSYKYIYHFKNLNFQHFALIARNRCQIII